MCLICIEIIKERLTAAEAFRNLREMMSDIEEEHFEHVVKKIIDLEQEERIKKRIEDER